MPTITKHMREALRYTKAVKVVKEWPMYIRDDTIRQLRKQGYLKTTVVSWNVHPASNVMWSNIEDRLTEKGRLAV